MGVNRQADHHDAPSVTPVKGLTLKVECYSGYKADERPLRFSSATHPARTYEVKEVLDQWYGLGYQCFKVRANDGNLYILRHHQEEDEWTLDSYRRDEKVK